MAHGNSVRPMELDNLDTTKEFSAKDSGVLTYNMEWENNTGQMGLFSLDTSLKVTKRTVNSNGPMGVVTKVILITANSKEEAPLHGKTKESTEDNGRTT